jgi:glycosyltransferase involved in cell wall biosynthesis
VHSWLQENFAGQHLIYHRNVPALGTPENWNECIRRATGTWIKLMHDDDWFSGEDALKILHAKITVTKAKFIHCNYKNVALSNDNKMVPKISGSALRKWLVKKYPETLYARNIIGPPSVVCVHRSLNDYYDKRMKWLVDIDYYIRILKKETSCYIPDILIHVGLGEEQVTQYTHNRPEVEIPEGVLLYQKSGALVCRNIFYYDAWWRLIRNLGIRSEKQFALHLQEPGVPPFILKIIQHQQHLPEQLLKIGILSKFFMFVSWLFLLSRKGL